MNDDELLQAYDNGWAACPKYQNDEHLYGLREVARVGAAKGWGRATGDVADYLEEPEPVEFPVNPYQEP